MTTIYQYIPPPPTHTLNKIIKKSYIYKISRNSFVGRVNYHLFQYLDRRQDSVVNSLDLTSVSGVRSILVTVCHHCFSKQEMYTLFANYSMVPGTDHD